MYSIVEEHYGNIHVDSPADPDAGRGTCVRLKLPAYEPDPGNAAISLNERS